VTRYSARYEFDGRAWVVRFREPDIATHGRTLRTAKHYARELLGAYLEVDDLEAVGVEIEDEVVLPQGAGTGLERLARKRREAESLRSEVAQETKRAAAELRRAGLSTRDVGEILGISGARVAQIERSA
jgi:predicted RNase H-like HicB family nuclease